MSKADNMFKKLRYEKISDDERSIQYVCSTTIEFIKEYKSVYLEIFGGHIMLSSKEIQAINEKVKELGWYE